jgi:phosphotransferase system  glucose/maltose/N-acetylglucosamine-specific IIC component
MRKGVKYLIGKLLLCVSGLFYLASGIFLIDRPLMNEKGFEKGGWFVVIAFGIIFCLIGFFSFYCASMVGKRPSQNESKHI